MVDRFTCVERPSIDSTQCSNVVYVVCFVIEVHSVKVIVHYRANGILRDWVCTYDRLDHILEVCEAKGFVVIGMEEL